MKRAVIVGSGSQIAPVRLSNAQMARILDTSDEWIKERSGVEQRYFASPEVCTSDLGTAAASKALDNAGVAKEAVDVVVFATMTPDHFFPGCGTIRRSCPATGRSSTSWWARTSRAVARRSAPRSFRTAGPTTLSVSATLRRST